MDNEQARARLLAERAEVQDLLRDTEQAGQQDRETEDEVAETGDIEDAASSLTAEGQDDSVAETLRERLEADPAAELTIEEARAGS